MNRIQTGILLLSVVGFWSSSLQAQPGYSVKNGNQLDPQTYRGYLIYRNWCARCHGTFAQGLAAPNLANSLTKLSKDDFMEVLLKGKKGRIGIMPGWRDNHQVMAGREQLYNYLRARADKAIGAVQPEQGSK